MSEPVVIILTPGRNPRDFAGLAADNRWPLRRTVQRSRTCAFEEDFETDDGETTMRVISDSVLDVQYVLVEEEFADEIAAEIRAGVETLEEDGLWRMAAGAVEERAVAYRCLAVLAARRGESAAMSRRLVEAVNRDAETTDVDLQRACLAVANSLGWPSFRPVFDVADDRENDPASGTR